MTVTFLRVARSSAAKRSSRRSRPTACETPVEARPEWGEVGRLGALGRLGLTTPRLGRRYRATLPQQPGESPASGDGGSPGSGRSSVDAQVSTPAAGGKATPWRALVDSVVVMERNLIAFARVPSRSSSRACSRSWWCSSSDTSSAERSSPPAYRAATSTTSCRPSSFRPFAPEIVGCRVSPRISPCHRNPVTPPHLPGANTCCWAAHRQAILSTGLTSASALCSQEFQPKGDPP